MAIKKITMKKIFSLIILLGLTFTTINASNNKFSNPNTLGFNIGMNVNTYLGTSITPTIGVSYEWVPKWSGIETGVYYTNHVIKGSITSPYEVGYFQLHTHSLKIPLYWKIHTKRANLALGLQSLWYLGYSVNDKKTTDGVTINYVDSPVIDPGLSFKVGFPIKVSNNFSVEPNLGVECTVVHGFAGNIGLTFRINNK